MGIEPKRTRTLGAGLPAALPAALLLARGGDSADGTAWTTPASLTDMGQQALEG